MSPAVKVELTVEEARRRHVKVKHVMSCLQEVAGYLVDDGMPHAAVQVTWLRVNTLDDLAWHLETRVRELVGDLVPDVEDHREHEVEQAEGRVLEPRPAG